MQLLEQMRDQLPNQQQNQFWELGLQVGGATPALASDARPAPQRHDAGAAAAPPLAWREVRPQDGEREILSPKPGGPGRWRRTRLRTQLLEADSASALRRMFESDSGGLMQWHEAEHHKPAFEFKVLDNGDGQGISNKAARSVLDPFVGQRLLPYVRELFGKPDLQVACCLLRRTAPEHELKRQVPQDGAAYATAVISLGGPADSSGGFFIEDSRRSTDDEGFLPLAEGDTVVYRHDTVQGIRVKQGCWWSIVVWFRGSDAVTAPWLEQEAEAGDADAQALLGGWLLEGASGFSADGPAARRWLGMATAQAHPGALYLMGRLLRDGLGGSTPQPDEALGPWLEAAKAGHLAALRSLGLALLERPGGAEEGLNMLRRASDRGDCEAMFKLFLLHRDGGPGGGVDVQTAEAYLARAADAGHAEAQNALGLNCLAGGKGNFKESLTWLGSAASKGVLEAQQLMAQFYRGSEGSLHQAWHWLLQAAKQGDVGCQRELGEMALEMSGRHVGEQADALQAIGRAWLRIAAARDGGAAGAAVAGAAGGERLGDSSISRCLSALTSLGSEWPIKGWKNHVQHLLEDCSEQAGALMGPDPKASITPSFHATMHLMQVSGNSDCLFRWSNSRGVADFPRAYTHPPSGSGLREERGAVVACAHWRGASAEERQRIADEAFGKLSSLGYVVLERLLPEEWIAPLEEEHERLLQGTEVVSLECLREHRQQTAMPFEAPWNEDWLVANDLVLEMVVRHICNNDALTCKTNADQAWAFFEWVAGGVRTGQYTEAPMAERASPCFGAIDVIRTPPHTMPQLRHRDTNLPGVCSSLTITVPLTTLTPENGPIGFVPRTHILETPGMEVLACPPPGSVIIYDSFAEHRGTENRSSRPRSVLSLTYDPGVWMRSFNPSHGGPRAWEHHSAFQRKIDHRLRKVEAAVRHGARWPEPESAGFQHEGCCAAGASCRGGRGAAEAVALAQDPQSGQWCCQACWDYRRYYETPDPSHRSAVGPRGSEPYMGLASW